MDANIDWNRWGIATHTCYFDMEICGFVTQFAANLNHNSHHWLVTKLPAEAAWLQSSTAWSNRLYRDFDRI